MAQVTYRIDDLDGKSKVIIDSTVITVGNQTVTIDLAQKHVDELTALLAPYFENGVVTTNVAKNARKTALTADNADRNVQIRQWATESGLTVNARGRLPGDVVKAYDDAHSSTETSSTPDVVDIQQDENAAMAAPAA